MTERDFKELKKISRQLFRVRKKLEAILEREKKNTEVRCGLTLDKIVKDLQRQIK